MNGTLASVYKPDKMTPNWSTEGTNPMNPPAFKFPKPFGAVLSLLPTYPHSLLFSQALNLALGRIIQPDLLEPLHGKLISIRVTDAGIRLFFSINATGFVACKAGKTPDLTISAALTILSCSAHARKTRTPCFSTAAWWWRAIPNSA